MKEEARVYLEMESKYGSGLEELRDSSFLRRLTETSRKRREGTWIRKKYKRE